jgi:hypothetical protein
MPGQIKFVHRALLDVVIAYVDWTIETEEDCLAWCDEYKRYFTGRFNRKVDLILELSKFHVNPRIATHWGKYRAQVLGEFTSRSYRVKQSALERTFMYTSSVLHGAPANHFQTIDQAIEALIKDRGQVQP